MRPKDLIKNYIYRTKNSNHYTKEGDEHFAMKGKVLKKFVDNGWNVMTECEFYRGRADLVAWTLDKNNNYIFEIIEILHSEKVENIEKKKTYYPKGIIIRKVKTSDDLNLFDI